MKEDLTDEGKFETNFLFIFVVFIFSLHILSTALLAQLLSLVVMADNNRNCSLTKKLL